MDIYQLGNKSKDSVNIFGSKISGSNVVYSTMEELDSQANEDSTDSVESRKSMEKTKSTLLNISNIVHNYADTTLSQLLECLTLEYSGNIIISPKWRNFKSQKLRFEEKSRINNAIWRCWHIQYVKKKNPQFCHFATPMGQLPTTKPLACVIEGRYWKRKLQAVANEYKRWRIYYKKKHQNEDISRRERSTSHDSVSSQQGSIPETPPLQSPMSHALSAMDAAFSKDTVFSVVSDTLFSSLRENESMDSCFDLSLPFKDSSDVYQPSLSRLQPSWDDLVEYYDSILESQEEQAGTLNTAEPENLMNVDVPVGSEIDPYTSEVIDEVSMFSEPMSVCESLTDDSSYVDENVYQQQQALFNPSSLAQGVQVSAAGEFSVSQGHMSSIEAPAAQISQLMSGGMSTQQDYVQPTRTLSSHSPQSAMLQNYPQMHGRIPRNVSDTQLYKMDSSRLNLQHPALASNSSFLPSNEISEMRPQLQAPNLVAHLTSIQPKCTAITRGSSTQTTLKARKGRIPRNMSDSGLCNLSTRQNLKAQLQPIVPRPSTSSQGGVTKAKRARIPRNRSDSNLTSLQYKPLQNLVRQRKMSDPSVVLSAAAEVCSPLPQQQPSFMAQSTNLVQGSVGSGDVAISTMNTQTAVTNCNVSTRLPTMTFPTQSGSQITIPSAVSDTLTTANSLSQLSQSNQQGLTQAFANLIQQQNQSPQDAVSTFLNQIFSPSILLRQPELAQRSTAELSELIQQQLIMNAIFQSPQLLQLLQLQSQKQTAGLTSTVSTQGVQAQAPQVQIPQEAVPVQLSQQLQNATQQLQQQQMTQAQAQQFHQTQVTQQPMQFQLQTQQQGVTKPLQLSTSVTGQMTQQVQPQAPQIQLAQGTQQQVLLQQNLLQNLQQANQVQPQQGCILQVQPVLEQGQQQKQQFVLQQQVLLQPQQYQPTVAQQGNQQFQQTVVQQNNVKAAENTTDQKANLSVQVTKILEQLQQEAIQAQQQPVGMLGQAMQSGQQAGSFASAGIVSSGVITDSQQNSTTQQQATKIVQLLKSEDSPSCEQGMDTSSQTVGGVQVATLSNFAGDVIGGVSTQDVKMIQTGVKNINLQQLVSQGGSLRHNLSSSSLVQQGSEDQVQPDASVVSPSASDISTGSISFSSPSSDGTPGSSSKVLPKDQRRLSHTSAEQKRRGNIRMGFDQLMTIVPSLSSQKNAKVSKATVLQKTVDHVIRLQRDRAFIVNETNRLKQELAELNASINLCHQQLPASGLPITRQKEERLKVMLNEYVKSRTQQNFKFWIFSVIMRPLFDAYCSTVSTSSLEEFCRTVLEWLDQHCALPVLRPAVLSSLRELSKATSILTEPNKLPEEALKTAMFSPDPTNLSVGCVSWTTVHRSHQPR